MKTTGLFLITLFPVFALLLPDTSAQDYTTWGLPDGATLRLGKGRRAGDIAFSPDGTRLAVGSAIGIWIYDVRPGKEKELDLITSHTGSIQSIVYAQMPSSSRVAATMEKQHNCGMSPHGSRK